MSSSLKSPSNPILEFKNVFFSYGKNQVFKNISFTLNEEESLVVLSPSGQGKSTLLKLANGVLFPDKGEVLLLGKNLKNLSRAVQLDIRSKIGFVFQNSGLLENQTVHQNIALPLTYHKGFNPDTTPKIIEKYIKLLGLEKVANERPAALSLEHKKRTAIARAMVLNPKIIMYDEPTSGLDSINSNELLHLIKKNNQAGAAVMLVTHRIVAARELNQKVALLNQGEFQFMGNYQELLATDDNFIREFVNNIR